MNDIQDTLSNNEHTFILNSLIDNKLRMDGRGLFDIRNIKISFEGNGIVSLQLGKTRVLVVIEAEIVAPKENRSTEGMFHFNIDLSPMATPSATNNSWDEKTIEIGRMVEKGLRESKAIDPEALCIIPGKKVWSIRCDMRILDDDGNLLDACSLGAIIGLLQFRRPSISVTGNNIKIYPIDEKDPTGISVNHIPIPITFAFFTEDASVFIADPSLKEELVALGRITFIMNIHKEICAIQKIGGIPLQPKTIIQCAHIAAIKVVEITQLIHKILRLGFQNNSFLDKSMNVNEDLKSIKSHILTVKDSPRKQSEYDTEALLNPRSPDLSDDDESSSEDNMDTKTDEKNIPQIQTNQNTVSEIKDTEESEEVAVVTHVSEFTKEEEKPQPVKESPAILSNIVEKAPPKVTETPKVEQKEEEEFDLSSAITKKKKTKKSSTTKKSKK